MIIVSDYNRPSDSRLLYVPMGAMAHILIKHPSAESIVFNMSDFKDRDLSVVNG